MGVKTWLQDELPTLAWPASVPAEIANYDWAHLTGERGSVGAIGSRWPARAENRA